MKATEEWPSDKRKDASCSKVCTRPFAQLAKNENVRTPVRVLAETLWRLSADGVPLDKGEAVNLWGRDADRAIRRVKDWGLLRSDSSARLLLPPFAFAFSQLDTVTPRLFAESYDYWFSMAKGSEGVIRGAVEKGMPLWLGIALFAQVRSSSQRGRNGHRYYLTSSAELREMFPKINAKTGEVQTPTRQGIEKAVHEAIAYGLLVEGSTPRQLIVHNPSRKAKPAS